MGETEVIQVKRNNGIDFIKGVCILLVVLDHAMPFSSTENFPEIVREIFAACFLKGFFCVSGYLYCFSRAGGNNTGRSDCLKKKFISLIFPYVIFSVLAICWHGILAVGFHCREISDTYTGWRLVLRDIYCMFSGIGIGTLWFLPVLFASYAILFFAVTAAGQNKKRQRVILTATFLIAELFSILINGVELSGNGMVMTVLESYRNTCYRILYGAAYSALGYLAYDLFQIIREKRLLVWSTAGCVLLGIAGYLLDSSPVFELGVCMAFFMIAIAAFDVRKSPNGPLSRFVLYCGRNSLAIMIYHYVFLLPPIKMLLKAMNGYRSFSPAVQEWIFFAVDLAAALVVVACLNRTEWGRFALGQGESFQNRRRMILRKWNRRDID